MDDAARIRKRTALLEKLDLRSPKTEIEDPNNPRINTILEPWLPTRVRAPQQPNGIASHGACSLTTSQDPRERDNPRTGAAVQRYLRTSPGHTPPALQPARTPFDCVGVASQSGAGHHA